MAEMSASEDPVELSRRYLDVVVKDRLCPPLTITMDIPSRFSASRLRLDTIEDDTLFDWFSAKSAKRR